MLDGILTPRGGRLREKIAYQWLVTWHASWLPHVRRRVCAADAETSHRFGSTACWTITCEVSPSPTYHFGGGEHPIVKSNRRFLSEDFSLAIVPSNRVSLPF
jgi:hypothetical protein